MSSFMVPQNNMMTKKVLDAIRHLSGPANNFVGESIVLTSLRGTGINDNYGDMQLMLASLVQANRLECFVPLVNNLGSCGPCGSDCGGCCNGACGGGCCGCGRYYRIKIG